MITSLSWHSITTRRMIRQNLIAPAANKTPADIARTLCGVHAQVIVAAELSVARRIKGATRQDVQRALWQDRTLVKTFGPRGTIHLLATADLPMWTGALSALPPSAPIHPQPVRFTPQQAEEVVAAIGDALAHSELTVDELTDAIEQRTGAWAVERTMDAFQTKWPRWRQLTSIAAHRGVLCFAANRGLRVTYTNPHRWLPKFTPQKGDQALRTLLKQYLYAYGPALPQHFAKWLNIPPRTAVELFKKCQDQLEQVKLEGQEAWVIAGDTESPKPHQGVRLLPYFDAFVVASQPRNLLYPGAASARALTPSGQAGNYPVLLINGSVGGVWHLKRTGKKLAITVEPLARLSDDLLHELKTEAELIGHIMQANATLTVGAVTVGAHA